MWTCNSNVQNHEPLKNQGGGQLETKKKNSGDDIEVIVGAREKKEWIGNKSHRTDQKVGKMAYDIPFLHFLFLPLPNHSILQL